MPKFPGYEKTKQAMMQYYGKKKGERIFYAWLNKHKESARQRLSNTLKTAASR